MDTKDEASFRTYLEKALRTTHRGLTLAEGSVVNHGNPIQLVQVDDALLSFIGRDDLVEQRRAASAQA